MKRIDSYNDLQDAMVKSPVFLQTRDNEKSIIKSLEPMEITIKKAKKETKITLSNRVAELIENQDFKSLIYELEKLVKEISKL